MIYRTSSWERLVTDRRELDPGFRRHLIEAAIPQQLAYRRLMRRFHGDPVGVECSNSSQDRWAFVLPDVSRDGKWRIQYFDESGFSGHGSYDTLVDAVQDMIQSGYRELDIGALDRLGSTGRWAQGVKRSAIMQRHAEGQIDWRTTMDLLTELQQEIVEVVA
ncbi:hypothetical protein [Paraburkholderia domus]|uniref:hypothetical protein n=1 Tax=Paraburkholderia domus TaxID=2793075 RepID=UPI00191379C5|nr:hypothetical protein [Paraburkholderia domus]MBK5065801.1 hypothetical protein [Burkholderia sp. R-70199]CAE6963280.1 hypothetical protein R70199_07491 [Paraburkholderia domus]